MKNSIKVGQHYKWNNEVRRGILVVDEIVNIDRCPAVCYTYLNTNISYSLDYDSFISSIEHKQLILLSKLEIALLQLQSSN